MLTRRIGLMVCAKRKCQSQIFSSMPFILAIPSEAMESHSLVELGGEGLEQLRPIDGIIVGQDRWIYTTLVKSIKRLRSQNPDGVSRVLPHVPSYVFEIYAEAKLVTARRLHHIL